MLQAALSIAADTAHRFCAVLIAQAPDAQTSVVFALARLCPMRLQL